LIFPTAPGFKSSRKSILSYTGLPSVSRIALAVSATTRPCPPAPKISRFFIAFSPPSSGSRSVSSFSVRTVLFLSLHSKDVSFSLRYFQHNVSAVLLPKESSSRRPALHPTAGQSFPCLHQSDFQEIPVLLLKLQERRLPRPAVIS